jgi:NADH-quinone oxidoreductase subunit C
MAITTEDITAKLQANFTDSIESAEVLMDMLTVTVRKAKIYEVIRFLKEEPSLNFHFLTTCCGIHYPDAEMRFGMMYQLHNMPENVRIRIKTFANEEEPVFPSLTPLWGSANWMEREAYDFYGFRFTGHPDLRRILNVDDMVGWPLRKEFPLEDQARYDKDDKMFGR